MRSFEKIAVLTVRRAMFNSEPGQGPSAREGLKEIEMKIRRFQRRNAKVS